MRADEIPGEIVAAVALALYECEKRRSDNADRVIAAARGIPTVKSSMEDWEDCADIFTSDAKAAINAYLDVAFPMTVGNFREKIILALVQTAREAVGWQGEVTEVRDCPELVTYQKAADRILAIPEMKLAVGLLPEGSSK